jgi:glycosyltransferase involved in cell wall biosynthesis
MNENPLVSIVIPAYNSERTLARCLESIQNQTYRNIEILVVDGGSKDKSTSISKKFGANVTVRPGLSMAASTNLGANISRGSYIYRVDSDVVLDPHLVEDAIYRCEKEGYDGACIFWLPDESISFWAKVRKIEKENYIKDPTFVGGKSYHKNILGARFLKREVFEKVGGFNEDVPIAGEDYAFYEKLAKTNYRFATISSMEKHIGEPRTLKEIGQKNFRYGYTFLYFLQSKNINDSVEQLSPHKRSYLNASFKYALHKGMKVFIGFLIYIVVIYFFTLMGLLYHIFTNKFSRFKRGSEIENSFRKLF